MNNSAIANIPREQVWSIACDVAIEVDEVRAGNCELQAKLPQANKTIQSLQSTLIFEKVVSNSSIPPSSSDKSCYEKSWASALADKN